MCFLDDIGPGFEPGKTGIPVNPIIIAIISAIIIAIIIVTAILIKKGNK